MRKVRTKKRTTGPGTTDYVVSVMEQLPRIIVRDEGPYTPTDRARDFIAVFNGTSDAEQGRRVLSQISTICDPGVHLNDADKHGTLAMKSGMRRVFHEIMVCMVARQPVQVEQ